ncbi:hypothetical protein OROGR_002109 [Orobanche gracilis]
MAAASAASSSPEMATEGPVLNMINKRLRALRKKLSRIAQMEESVSQGKTLNKEQEETLRSKSFVIGGVEELEKLRHPLSQAVGQEIELALDKNKQKLNIGTTEVPKEVASVDPDAKSGHDDDASVSDLLKLLYFGSVFDVHTLMRAHGNMLTRTHERTCCLTYDYVTDDDAAGDPLKEWDLDLIAMLGGVLVSRPVNSSLSHKNALQKCVEHAKLWLANAEQPIDPNSTTTYSGLREKLNKIMASDYFTTTPEIKAPVEVAAAGVNYTSFQVPVQGSMAPLVNMTVPPEGSAVVYQQEEEQSLDSRAENYVDDSGHVVEPNQGDTENASEIQTQKEQGTRNAEIDQNSRDVDLKEQFPSRKSYQNYRGGRGGGGGYRGNGSGRGGRGGSRGVYQNGRSSQFYEQANGYHPRSNYNYRGRGGRGMGANDSYHGPAQESS